MKWSLDDVAATVRGTAFGQATITAVTTDSRHVPPASLFVALRGEFFDGHDFANQALDDGAAAILVEVGSQLEPRVEATDTLQALGALGARRRRELNAQSVAITGSTGKTSTKDLLASALGVGTWASPRSFNNEVGVPLTVLMAPDDTEVLVLEVGSRGIGHIRNLIPIIEPDVAVITGIGLSHIATLGDVDNVRQAKWELVEGLDGGVAVLPAGQEQLIDWAFQGGIEVVTFGGRGADVEIGALELDEIGRPSFTLRSQGEHARVGLQLAGAHQASNAAAAAAAALILGRALPDVAAGLALAGPSLWRMEVHPGRFTVVNDAYNANPDSMEAALRTVAAMPGRHLAILGLMAELGPAAPEAHVAMGSLAKELGFEVLVVVGEDPGLAAGAGKIAEPVATPAEAKDAIEGVVRDGDVVLVKASRAVGLEGLAQELAQ
ncbi:MAG: UDP-N-acetylmuramoyl-tripeptide--D-alanyl-D-alanine ligase [Acidimicrobiia bacterium]